jgi:hypothetical protein
MNGGEPQSAALDNVVAKLQQRFRHYLDKTVVWPKARWVSAATSLLVFGIRVKVREGFYLVAYALALYLLNILVGFLSPAEDPSEGITLPQNEQEFRPFTRKLPEFKAWVQAQKALALSIFATFFRVFDMPVFWPILLVYFLFLFAVTMRRQVSHMIQHKYVPFSWGKQTYREITRGK